MEAGRAASSAPTTACMRCLGSSKQQVCCQAIHAGVWERWARRILATAVACVAPAGAGVVHGYQLESEPRDRDSVALQQRCLQRGLKVGPYSRTIRISLCTEVRATSATATDSTQYDFTRNQPAALVAAQSTRRAPAPPACTSQHLPRSTILHKLHLSIMSYLPWLKWRGGCGWVAKLSRSCCWNTGLQLQQPVSLLQGGIKPRSILRCGISNCPLQTSLATALHRRAVLVLRPPRLHAPSSCPAARLGCLGPSWPPFPSAWRQRCPSPYCP